MTDLILFYLVPTIVVIALYLWSKQYTYRQNLAMQEDAIAAGLHEPDSLHPLIDHAVCIGCNACVAACPEQSVLGLIDNRGELITAANCIGHGACRSACPVSAITLVLGSETRGVEIPHIKPNFETNVPGLFIAGELGGMGLIRNAAIQGQQAVSNINNSVQAGHGFDYDLLIVGAGPAGISASLAAKKAGLTYLTIDQDSLGGTVAHFPRQKIVMTQPVQLSLVGKVKFRETSKEALLEFWREVVDKHQLNIRFAERAENVQAIDSGFEVQTSSSKLSAQSVLLCLGRRGTPRKLEVPGEELPKVVYRLIDPGQYRKQHVLVVGGGDSAVEAALSIAEQAEASVSLAYRGEAFSRVKPDNRLRLDQASDRQELRVLLQTKVKSIGVSTVTLGRADGEELLKNDAVIVCAGGIMPRNFLAGIGVDFEIRHGTA